jgi:protocatechuate 3,4-dioxygenase beta subunit
LTETPSDAMPDPSVTRRRLLVMLGAGAAAALAACSKGASTALRSASTTSTTGSAPSTTASSASTASAAGAAATGAGSCVLSPELTEGPYYLPGEAIRSDITEGKPGTPLKLVLPIVDATTCTPISGATVEIWHADAGGNYSGFGAATSNRTFLRGGQVTDARGEATFVTIYPGWYAGRATHIHVKVHVAGKEVHTGQLFFDESTNDAVYAASPYSSRRGSRTRNVQDAIYAQGGSQSMVALTPDGSGYTGRLTMGVRTT